MTRTEDERCKHTIFIVSLDLIAGKQLKLPWISFQLLITRVRTSSCWRTHRGIVAGIIGVKEGIDHLGVSFRFYNSSSMSMILLISCIICFPLRGKDWGANGHWIEFLKRSVSVSDAITKLFSPFAFYLFHSTKSARHDNTLPRTGVHSRSRRWWKSTDDDNKDKGGWRF